MNRNIFGWSYPPGVSERDIDEHFGSDDPEEECTHPDTYTVFDPAVQDDDGEWTQYYATYCKVCGECVDSGIVSVAH